MSLFYGGREAGSRPQEGGAFQASPREFPRIVPLSCPFDLSSPTTGQCSSPKLFTWLVQFQSAL